MTPDEINSLPRLQTYSIPGETYAVMAWCDSCTRWHHHSAATENQPIGTTLGHRAAHCRDRTTKYKSFVVSHRAPYYEHGYILEYAGKAEPWMLKDSKLKKPRGRPYERRNT